jgi:hypothetical protein
MFGLLLVATAISVAAYLALSRRLGRSESWSAMLTPLASIMGSGFLVSAPLLAHEVGYLAAPCMAALLVLAYGVGGVLRFNIRHFEPVEHAGPGPAQILAHLSRIVLAAAYFISITYYLQLLAAFALHFAGVESPGAARWVTTSLLAAIGAAGMWRGLAMFERIEKYFVSVNLGVIGALLVALFVHNAEVFRAGTWSLPDIPSGIDGHGLRVLLGLLIVVQGFETSRYLGSQHPAELRIRTMRQAQIVASIIYVLFLSSATLLYRDDLGADVTAIITMVTPVAFVLPVMLSVAAIGSQFSAAVADTSGAGGLVEDLTSGRVPRRYLYLLILIITVALTWETNVNEIISYASRAFALYYTLQCLVAALVAGRSARLVYFGLLAAICLSVFLFGLPAE